MISLIGAFPTATGQSLLCEKALWRKGAKPLPLLKYWNLAFHFCTFLCFQDFGTIFDRSQDFDLEIYFTHERSCTYFLSVLHMKPFPVTVHCLLSFVAFLLLVDPKRDMWTPESTLLTFGLILPHVPGMKHLIFICFVHICIQISSLSCFFSIPSCPCQKNTEKWCYRIILISTSLSWLEHGSMIPSKGQEDSNKMSLEADWFHLRNKTSMYVRLNMRITHWVKLFQFCPHTWKQVTFHMID